MASIRATGEDLPSPRCVRCLIRSGFAENAGFIKQREPGYGDAARRRNRQEMFSYADGMHHECQEGRHGQYRGFSRLNDDAWPNGQRMFLILTEGFQRTAASPDTTWRAIATGLFEALDHDYLLLPDTFNDGTWVTGLTKSGIPIVLPTVVTRSMSMPARCWRTFAGANTPAHGGCAVGGLVPGRGHTQCGDRERDVGHTATQTELKRTRRPSSCAWRPARVYTQSMWLRGRGPHLRCRHQGQACAACGITWEAPTPAPLHGTVRPRRADRRARKGRA